MGAEPQDSRSQPHWPIRELGFLEVISLGFVCIGEQWLGTNLGKLRITDKSEIKETASGSEWLKFSR